MSTASGKADRRRPASETPMMAQYLRAKSEHPGAILLFRMGDFYETFFEDARVLARDTGVVLTSRNSGDPDPIPLAGFPWHQADSYVAKLLKAGHRVAICEQVEEPGKGKKLLERRVIEVLSPGTALQDGVLAAASNNYLVALRVEGGAVGLAAADISTGEFLLGELPLEAAGEELGRLRPAEILAARGEEEAVARILRELEAPVPRTVLDPWRFSRERGRRALLEQYGVVSLEAFEAEEPGPALGAAGALLEYAREQKQSELRHLRPPRRLRAGEGLVLDDSTLRSLEILEPLPGGGGESTLLSVLDRTQTAAGARKLRAELRRPPGEPEEIARRQDAVEALMDGRVRAGLRERLKGTADLERILGRLHCGKASPRDLGALRQTLVAEPEIARLVSTLERRGALPLPDGSGREEIARRLQSSLAESPPPLLSDGGVFRDGWNADLDELRRLARDAKGWIAELQDRERAATGIPTLKVGYNRVFGYYIEVTQSQLSRVPDRYQRKQTLAGAERFLTPELKEFEQKVLHAEEEQLRLERELFEALCEEVRVATPALQRLAEELAAIDFFQSLAEAGAEGRWCRPLVDRQPRIRIVAGRHPVVESSLGAGTFVANDTELDGEFRQVAVLTGPNMAGKSTYLRQVGLVVVLAHLGSFVPAERAEIGARDRIFTRVGAHDSLARGQSTFLVEMIETSRILHHATPHSLVLLDEVGRGTSTYDGLAIAWAVAEALESPAGPRPLSIFATHFHELTRLARPGRGFLNLNVVVREWEDRVIFLRRVEEGAADRSYGIHVARLAGVPESVVARAREILLRLESEARRIAPPPDEEDGGAGGATPGGVAGGGTARPSGRQLHLFSVPEPPFLDELRKLDPDRLTPLEALSLLARWRRQLERSDRD